MVVWCVLTMNMDEKKSKKDKCRLRNIYKTCFFLPVLAVETGRRMKGCISNENKVGKGIAFYSILHVLIFFFL